MNDLQGETQMQAKLKDYFTLLVKPTSLCNLRCSYCYQNRNNLQRAGWMQDSTLEILTKHACNLPVSQVAMEWIGGETLLAGVDFFERALEYQQRFNSRRIKILNAIQTNGTLLNDKWFSFFLKHPEFGLSISFDLFEELQDLNRKTPNGKGTYKKVHRNLLELQTLEIPFGILITVTPDALNYPAGDWVDLLVRERFLYVGLQLDYNFYSGNNRDLIERYLSFLEDLFYYQAQHNQSVKNPQDKLLIRESYYLYNRIERRNPQKRSCHNTPRLCLDYLLSVDLNGEVYACCDAFLGIVSEKYGNFSCGNILEDDFNAIFKNHIYRKLYKDMNAGRIKCHSCEYFPLCQGGCGLFKSLQSGKVDSGPKDDITSYCTLQKGYFSFVTDVQKRAIIRKSYNYL